MRQKKSDEFFVPITEPSGRFRRAILVSACAHLAVIFLSAFLAAFFSRHSDDQLPESIQFVFVPEDENAFESAAPRSQIESNVGETHQRRRAVPSSVNLDAESQAQVPVSTGDLTFTEGQDFSREQTPLTSAEKGLSPTETSPTPNFLANASDLSPIRSTQTFNPEPQHSHLDEPHFDKNFRLSKAKLTIPNRDQKRLLRKLKKMTNHFIPPTSIDSSFSLTYEDQQFNVTVKHEEAANPSAFDQLIVDVTTESNGRLLGTQMRMQRLGFSHFAQFVDYWDPRVVVHDDQFDGRFHTNTDFAISGNDGKHPRFLGKVTTSGYTIHQRLHPAFFKKDSVFQAGLEIGTAPIKFPKKLYDLVESVENDSSVFRFDEECWIEFERDGGFSWRKKSGAEGRVSANPSLRLLTIVSQSKNKLHVSGTLAGRALVYNVGKIVICGDVFYKNSPEFDQESDDYLGLVSENSVEIAPPKVTGSGDLYIYAAIMTKGAFRVVDYQQQGNAQMRLYGSLTAGSITATEPRYGTRIVFDRRLETKRPPNFPMTNRYEMQEWDEKWEVLEDSLNF